MKKKSISLRVFAASIIMMASGACGSPSNTQIEGGATVTPPPIATQVEPDEKEITEETPEMVSEGPDERVNHTTSGVIDEDEIWRDEIHITGDIQFANGATLTIEPGTIVYIASNSDDRHANDTGGCYDEITCGFDDPTTHVGWGANAVLIDGRRGVINAVGAPDEPIVFRPEGDSTSTSQYDGIYIERGALKYSRILYGSGMQVLGQPGAVEVAYNEIRHFLVVGIGIFKEDAWVHHNILEGGGHQAIGLQTHRALIEHNTILRCNLAVNSEGAPNEIARDVIVRNNLIIDCGNGIAIGGMNVEASNNTIAYVDGPPDGIYYQGELVYPVIDNWIGGMGVMVGGEAVVVNNIIYGEFTHAILATGTDFEGIVDYNMVWESIDPFGGAGAELFGDSNTIMDPLFADLENWDLSLSPESPAIDAGSPELTDPGGSPSDIGAYGGPHGDGW